VVFNPDFLILNPDVYAALFYNEPELILKGNKCKHKKNL